MLSKLLQPKVAAFIKANQPDNPNAIALDKLLFNKRKYPDIPIDLVVNQIRARQKAKHKLPLWFKTEGVIMPPLLSMEQASSEQAALYKSKLFKGDVAIDLTGGAGVDSFYLSKQFKKVIYVEYNKAIAEIANHNFKVLGATNIKVFNSNSEDFIAKFNDRADLIYLDPARREQHKKLFLLEDCSPNILLLQQDLLVKATKVMVKASPMLDISKVLNQLERVSQVQIIAIKNEVKELLFIQSQAHTNATKITAIDLTTGKNFYSNWSYASEVDYSKILTFLYEPNVAILKSTKVNVLGEQFELAKLNPNTHLFTSNKLIKAFPGRIFKVIKILKYDKRELKKELPNLKANIAIRNFPDTVAEIRKKMGIKPGGSVYIFGVRDIENKAKILLCNKILT